MSVGEDLHGFIFVKEHDLFYLQIFSLHCSKNNQFLRAAGVVPAPPPHPQITSWTSVGAWRGGVVCRRLRMEGKEEVGTRKRNLTGHPRSF